MDERKIFTLAEVTRSIQKTISERYRTSFWVKAEMNKLNHYSHSGHCYPDLVEKKDGRVIAQMRASLWKDDFRRINHKFLSTLNEPLKDGINILFLASINFDAVHSLSLRIIDIDPVYSLGELEREKQESIRRLTEEGIFNANKARKLELLPQRIAVISVETSKGYSDYINILEKNPWGYRFFNVLFPSLLQGERSVGSILNQLRRIKKVITHFDAVAIVRGGGGDVGLSSYNNYELAREVALFPIPVFTGIGHSTNETVVELVAHKNAITPSELADFLIRRFHDFAEPLRKAEKLVIEASSAILYDEKIRLENLLRYFQSITRNHLLRSRHALNGCTSILGQESKFLIRREAERILQKTTLLREVSESELNNHRDVIGELGQELASAAGSTLEMAKQNVERAEKNVSIMDPINVLKRGFSITLNAEGKTASPENVEDGEMIRTIFADGELISRVEKGKQP